MYRALKHYNYRKFAISELCEVIGGYAFPSSTLVTSPSKYQVIKMSNLYQGSLDLTRNPSYVEDITPGLEERFLLKDKDILISLTGTVGKRDYGYTVLLRNPKNLLLNQRVCAIRVKECSKANPLYLFYSFKRRDFLDVFFDSSVGGTGNQSNVSINSLKEIEVSLPPLPEQERIAAILSTWDEAIAKTQSLIERKEETYKILSIKLLFGKKRLTKFSQIETRHKTNWFSIPNDWELIPISKIASEVSERNAGAKDIPVLSCTKHHGLVNSLEYFGKQIFSKDTSTYKVVKRNEFAYATNHIEEGSIGYQNLHDAGLVSPMYTVFNTDKSKVCDGYLYKVLKTEIFRHIFEANTTASVDRRGSLRWNQFSEIEIPFPNKDEQIVINDVLDIAKSEIKRLQDYKSLLVEQKKGLMQKLLTGEWPVTMPAESLLQEAVAG